MILIFATVAQKDKFEYLYTTYKGLMFHKASGILRDYRLAEDAVSEAFIRIYKNLDKIEEEDKGRTAAFVVTIVKNVALTMLAQENRQALTPLEEAQSDRFDLEYYVLGEMSATEIIQVIDTLKADLRDVFLLSYAHECSHQEIGRLLGISANNVTVRLHRARKKLAELLIQGGYVHEK